MENDSPYISPNYVFSDDKLVNALFWEFHKPEIDREKVLQLIAQGANVNAVLGGESLLMQVIFYQDWEGINLDAIQFMIDLGVDLNYEQDGANYLYGACLTHSTELVELLLKAGANPNCAGCDECESLLDWAEFDQWVDETGGILQAAKK